MAKAIKFTTGELNLMKEFNLDQMDPMNPVKIYTAQNPFSGVEVELNEFCAKLYRTLDAMYARYNAGDPSFKVAKYDRLKYLLLKINSDAYMSLID